jgi:UDP-N-acetyl-D-glucosamine dehydrogenase
MKVAIIGQGYVGLPLALAASESGYEVFGIDKNIERVISLNSGRSFIEDISDSELKKNLNYGNYKATNDSNVISNCEIILICVPTPVSDQSKPDLTLLVEAATMVGRHVSEGALVIIESTVEPGTTRNLIAPIISKESKLKPDQYDIAFSPERIDPANLKWKIKNTPKLVAGLSESATKRAQNFYSRFVDEVVICDSTEVAETAKLLENSFRFINISFINEMFIFCHKLGIDIHQVISAASTKPYGFMPFYPSIGVGGHCIPVDPLYLANKAYEIGAPSNFINLAHKFNQELPIFFVSCAEEMLGDLKGKKVLVVGVAYKPNVADVRETPAEALILELKKKGAVVFWHDDLVNKWNGEKSVSLTTEYDLAILATPHDYLDLTKLGDVPILNTQRSI